MPKATPIWNIIQSNDEKVVMEGMNTKTGLLVSIREISSNQQFPYVFIPGENFNFKSNCFETIE